MRVTENTSYDANGNTLSDAQGRSFTWDFENRLTQAVNPSVGTTTFKYDPFGRRIQKSGPLGTTNYLYDRMNLVAEIDSSGNVLARYTQRKGVDQPLAQLRSGTTSYYEQDGLGSITSLSNAAGAVAETYTYDSYGKPTASTGTLTNPFQYTGREFDTETGIYYYRARYFDPTAGRFLNQDPIRFGGGANFYAYTRNNPVARIDPFGYDGTCNNPAYCVPGSATWGTMYLGPDGVWYNDGPPPDPAPPVPDDGPTPSPDPPDPNKKCDHSQDQPQDQPPPDTQTPPPTTTDCDRALTTGTIAVSADIVGLIPGFGNVVSGIAAGAGIAAGISDDDPTGAAASGTLLGLSIAEGTIKGGKVIPGLGNVLAGVMGVYDGYQLGKTMARCEY